MPEDPKPAPTTPRKKTLETSNEFTVAMGATIMLAGYAFTIEPQDVGNLDEGSFEIKLPKDETRVLGSLQGFYDAVNHSLEDDDLPDLDWGDLKPPLKNLVEADVTLQEFVLTVVGGKVKRLCVDVTMATDWKPAAKINFEIDRLRFVVSYEPKRKPATAS
jgi:hypothetical protein